MGKINPNLVFKLLFPARAEDITSAPLQGEPQLIRNILEAEVKRAAPPQKGLKIPPCVIFSPTDVCNLSCKDCFLKGENGDCELGSKEVDELFDELEDLGIGFVVMIGGEPFIRNDIPGLIKKHRKLSFMVFTNATLVNEEVLRILKANDNVLLLYSLEGFRPETDTRRGKGTFDDVILAMNRSRRMGLLFGFSVTLFPVNMEVAGSASFVDRMVGEGCRLGIYIDSFPGRGELGEGPWRDENLYSTFLRNFEVLRDREDIFLVHSTTDELNHGSCLGGRSFVYISAYGDVSPCPMLKNIYGNVRKRPLRDILDDAQLNVFWLQGTEGAAHFPCRPNGSFDHLGLVLDPYKSIG